MFHLISFTYLALGGFSFSHGYIFEMLSFCHGRNSLMCGVYCKTDKSRSRFCINQSFHHKDTKFVAAVKHRIAVGSICHIFVVDSPNRRGNVNVIILLSVSFTFFGSQSGVQCLTVGRLQHSLWRRSGTGFSRDHVGFKNIVVTIA